MTQNTLQEIQKQITSLNESIGRKKEQIEAYRTKRAEITVNEADTQKSKARITSIDSEIKKLTRDIENAPAELKLLEEKLAAEQRRVAEAERTKLIKQQEKVADELTLLSKNFIASLEKSVECNNQLQATLMAETQLQKKTGQCFPTERCRGSLQSLSLLLKVMQDQMQGAPMTRNEETSKNIHIML